MMAVHYGEITPGDWKNKGNLRNDYAGLARDRIILDKIASTHYHLSMAKHDFGPTCGYEHTCRDQCAQWCNGCVNYLSRHPYSKQHRMWYCWVIVRDDGRIIDTYSTLTEALSVDASRDHNVYAVEAVIY